MDKLTSWGVTAGLPNTQDSLRRTLWIQVTDAFSGYDSEICSFNLFCEIVGRVLAFVLLITVVVIVVGIFCAVCFRVFEFIACVISCLCDCCLLCCLHNKDDKCELEAYQYKRLRKILNNAGFRRELSKYDSQQKGKIAPVACEQYIVDVCVKYLIRIAGSRLNFEPLSDDVRKFTPGTEDDIALVVNYRSGPDSQSVLEYLLERDTIEMKNDEGYRQVLNGIWDRLFPCNQKHRYSHLGQSDECIETIRLLKCIFHCVRQETRSEILMGSGCMKWLRVLVKGGNVKALKSLLWLLSPSEKQSLLCCSDGVESSILFRALDSPSAEEMIEYLSSQLTVENWIMLLNRGGKSFHKGTVLHYAVSKGKFDLLKLLLQKEPARVIPEVINTVDADGKTFLHFGASTIPSDIFNVVNNSTPDALWKFATSHTVVKKGDSTIFHSLAIYHRHDVIMTILSLFSLESQIRILGTEDRYGRSTVDFIGDAMKVDSKAEKCTGCNRLLRHWKDLLISIVKNPPQPRAKNVYLKTLIETQSLALSEIETLYSHSDQYIIPYIQRETERRAMVLYNTYQREKSVEEARIMHQGLEKAGFKSSSIEWTNALQLPKILYEKIHENVQTTSVLFVCIMSHGSAGMILGKDSSWMPISDILTLLGNVLPEYLPLVVVIQACQNYDCQLPPAVRSLVDANAGKPDEKKYITLERPNTLLLLSAVTGSFAKRGAYTGALAEQIAAADGVKIIEELQATARIEMLKNHPEYKAQIPEMRSTLMKKLVLPPARLDQP